MISSMHFNKTQKRLDWFDDLDEASTNSLLFEISKTLSLSVLSRAIQKESLESSEKDLSLNLSEVY